MATQWTVDDIHAIEELVDRESESQDRIIYLGNRVNKLEGDNENLFDESNQLVGQVLDLSEENAKLEKANALQSQWIMDDIHVIERLVDEEKELEQKVGLLTL